MEKDRCGDLFHDLFLRPELERLGTTATAVTIQRPAIERRAQDMHADSLLCYREELGKFGKRAAAVAEWVARNGCVTDREIMRGLGFTDPNAVRPRISELIDGGVLQEFSKVKDPVTRKLVRRVGLPFVHSCREGK